MQLNQADPDVDVPSTDDDELLMLHTALHSFYREFQLDREVEGWDLDSVVQTHEEVREEMEDRELPHQELSDLDDEDPDEDLDQSVVSEWASEFVESSDPTEFIQSNPPEMDWYLEAIDAVQEIDESVDLTDYVTLSATDVDDLDQEEHPVEWLQGVGVGSVVGYTLNEEEDSGVVLAKQDGDFGVYLNDDEVWCGQSGDVGYEQYEDISQRIEDGEAYEEISQSIGEEVSDEEVDLFQGEVIEDTDAGEHRWYIWEQDEAETWLENNNFDTSEPVEEGEFLSYPQAEEGDFEVLENEWRGPWFPPHNFVQGFDERPVLLTVGKTDEESLQAEVQAIKFQVERPPELPDLQASGEIDYYWYQFDQAEAREWLKERDIAAGASEQDGPFARFEVESADRYEDLETVWEGLRQEPESDALAGGDKPRRVVYGVDEDGEREMQAVEFLTEPTMEQRAVEYINRLGVDPEEISDVR